MTSTALAVRDQPKQYGGGAFGSGPSLRDPYYAEVIALRDKVAGLEAELRYVKDLISPPGLIFPQRWKLTGKEEILLRALMAAVSSTKERLLVSLYDSEPEAEIKIVDVFICKIRKKLSTDGIEIDTMWGSGYRIQPKMKAMINAACEATKNGEEWISPLIEPQVPSSPVVVFYTGADLREQRYALGISQASLARAIGAPDPGYVTSVERGAGLPIWQKAMAKALRDERRRRKMPEPGPL